MLGTAAIRSTRETSRFRRRPCRTSESSNAVPSDSGKLTASAMNAIETVPNSTAATPNVWVSGDQSWVVKNAGPILLRAVLARIDRNTPTASMISTVTVPLASTLRWKMRSATEFREAIRRGASSASRGAGDARSDVGGSMAGPGLLGSRPASIAAIPPAGSP